MQRTSQSEPSGNEPQGAPRVMADDGSGASQGQVETETAGHPDGFVDGWAGGGVMDLGALVPDPENRRQHTPRNLGMVVDALHKVGAARSIVIDENNVILAGNGVTDAAAEAGITKVQVVEADGETLIAVRRRGLTAEQKRVLAIADNRSAELATWNLDQLQQDQAAGLDLSAFWDPDELLRLLGTAVVPTWDGMPAFEQENQQAWRTLHVHFTRPEDFTQFCELLGRTDVTDQTRFIWYPQVPRERAVGIHRYRTDDAPEPVL